MGDDRVRPGHAAHDWETRTWSDSPDPGEDYNCRCWAAPLPNNAFERKKAVLGKGKADFSLKPDINPVDAEPYYALAFLNEVNNNEKIIIEESERAKIDPDLIRAIIYVETSQGWYDRFNPWKKSIRPMNIQAEYWKDLGYTREDLETSRLNIRAGVNLIQRLKSQPPYATVEEIATLYNDLNAKRVSDYGARVKKVMKEKPWKKNQ